MQPRLSSPPRDTSAPRPPEAKQHGGDAAANGPGAVSNREAAGRLVNRTGLFGGALSGLGEARRTGPARREHGTDEKDGRGIYVKIENKIKYN